MTGNVKCPNHHNRNFAFFIGKICGAIEVLLAHQSIMRQHMCLIPENQAFFSKKKVKFFKIRPEILALKQILLFYFTPLNFYLLLSINHLILPPSCPFQ